VWKTGFGAVEKLFIDGGKVPAVGAKGGPFLSITRGIAVEKCCFAGA